jgi:cytochrome c biogenesis protein ResB
MLNFIKKFWDFLGRSSLSIWLIYALSIDILVGSVIMKHHPRLFFSMERLMLQEWIVSYGTEGLHITWWFFLALFLVFLLAVNTFVCTTNRVISIIGRFADSDRYGFFLRLSPHIIHVGFMLILLGQLISHTLGVNLHSNILHVGGRKAVPCSDISVALTDLKIEFFEKGTHFLGMEGKPENVAGILSIIDSEGVHKRTISINRPVWHKGWSFHLENYYPKSKGMARAPFINLIIRRDPGIRLMAAGAVIFAAGLIIYLFFVSQVHINRVREA